MQAEESKERLKRVSGYLTVLCLLVCTLSCIKSVGQLKENLKKYVK